MRLEAGTKLGPFEILSSLGAGGMGEVYQARDSKLGRDVAIKVLPEAFAHDAERLSRFQREAKLLAALNHSNIATIHGLEESNGTHYLVMELVAGETLADRIHREGALPIEEALPIARQITEALEAAHEKGIIHRDLKPANVKVTPEGKVKVLDFGLAKAFAADGVTEDPSNSPTLSAMATVQGVILGTAAYMSPEQARGKAVDKRTDIWAFGCLLYEMLAGKQAFQGEDITEILAAVVKTEPDWNRLPPATPAKIGDLLHRCLQKDRSLRMRDAGDARIEIAEALSARAAEGATAALPAKGFRAIGRRPLAFGLGALLLGAVIATLATWNLKPEAPRPVSRLSIDLPSGAQLVGLNRSTLAISPDGSHLVYVAAQGGTQQLYLRDMDSLEARPIPGTEGASTPFFSPDGQWVGFFAGGKLKKVPVNGGAPINLCDAGFAYGASWSRKGTIVFGTTGPLMEVSDAGGTPKALTHLEKGETAQGWPEFLPDGKAVLFAAAIAPQARVAAYSLETGERHDLIQGAFAPHYLPSGYLVYSQTGGNLMAVPFDAQRLRVTGTAVPVAQGVLINTTDGATQYSVSDTGSLVYASGGAEATQRKLVWVDRKGKEQPLPAPPHGYRYPRLSPDGGRVAVTIEEGGDQVWVYDLRRDTLTRLTFEGGNITGAWTPDGQRIAFGSNKEGGGSSLFWERADGSGGVGQLNTSQYIRIPNSFSPDGQELAFVQISPKTGFDIEVLRMSNRKAQPFLQTPFTEGAPTFSPDGHWLAYVSNESGSNQIYVRPYPGPGGQYQISTNGGTEPVWNPRGGELFYRSGDKMMAVPVQTKGTFSAGTPHMLFEGQYVPTPATFPDYDVSRDGQRFLMLKAAVQAQASTQINVVLNWTEALKGVAPTGTK